MSPMLLTWSLRRVDSIGTPDQSKSSHNNSSVPASIVKPKVTTYDKGVQTTPSSRGTGDGDNYQSDSDDEASRAQAKQKARSAIEAEIRTKVLKELEMQREIDRLEDEEHQKQLERKQKEALPSADLRHILASSEFQAFIDDSSKILERALNDNYDYLRDYSIGDAVTNT